LVTPFNEAKPRKAKAMLGRVKEQFFNIIFTFKSAFMLVDVWVWMLWGLHFKTFLMLPAISCCV
jgi:hypothetical protein